MLSLNLLTLESRKVTIKLKAERALQKIGSQGGGLTKRAFSALARFGGWAFGKVVSFFNISFDSIWDTLVDAYFELKEFDFNASDKELNQQIEQNNKQLEIMAARALGEQVGIGTVRLVTAFAGKFLPGKKASSLRAAEGIKIPVFSQRLALDLADEQNSQLRADSLNFLTSAGRAMTSNALINAVLFTRKYELFGGKPITQDIEVSGSIAAKIGKKIEEVPKRFRDIVSSFGDGLEQGIIQAGYVIASAGDDHIAMMRYEQDRLKNDKNVLTLEVDPEGDGSDSLTFVGTPEEIEGSVSTVMPLYPILQQAGNAGVPQAWALKPGADRPQLVVSYRAQNKHQSTSSFSVPHYSGSKSPRFPDFEHGNWMGLWALSDGSKIQVYASTEREAGNMIRAFSKGIPRKYKTGRPRYINTDQKIGKKKMKYVGCSFYEKGVGTPVTWKGYRN
jgi:hypothetical protein